MNGERTVGEGPHSFIYVASRTASPLRATPFYFETVFLAPVCNRQDA